MKRMMFITAILGALFALCSASAQAIEPMQARDLVIPFQATILDDAGLSYDGPADVEAWFYKSSSRDASELLYAESFSAATVDRGILRLPLLTGVLLGGAVLAPTSLTSDTPIYVDIVIDGTTMIGLHPLRPWIVAMRAEHAQTAEGLRTDFKLSETEIPLHPATLITSGAFDLARIPAFPASRITSGTFEMGQVPEFSASKVQGGTFPPDAMPSSMSAAMFPTGTLLDGLISSDVMRNGDVGFDDGVVGNNGSVPVPPGFDRSQCASVLSLRNIQGGGGVDQYHITTGSNGEVQCNWSPKEDGGDEDFCTANYLIVCYK